MHPGNLRASETLVRATSTDIREGLGATNGILQFTAFAGGGRVLPDGRFLQRESLWG